MSVARINAVFCVLWILLFVFSAIFSYDDPSSIFFNAEKAYKQRFSSVRAAEADAYIRNPPARVIPTEPVDKLLCIGIPSVNRTTESFLSSTIATLSDTLAPEERASIRIVVLLADKSPSEHFAYGQQWLEPLVDEVLLYGEPPAGSSVYRRIPFDLKEGRTRGDGRVENMRLDHSALVEACREQEYPYFALVEDDIVTTRDWFPRFKKGLASAHSSDNNITVVFPKSTKDIEVSRLNKDGTYHISTFPETIQNIPTNNTAPSKIDINPKVPAKFTLPAWNGKPGGLGVAIDNDYTRSVFWIGTDKKLHEAANINFEWQMMPNQSTQAWPLADEANADLAVTYNFDSSEAWVYYVSNNTVIQAYRGSNGTWSKASVVPTSTTVPGSGDGGSDSGPDSGDGDGDSSPSTGLSPGAKAGIGIGVSVGAIGVGLLGLFFFLRRRRQRAAAAAAEADKEQPTTNMGQYQAPSEQALYMADGSLAPAYTPQTPYDAHDPSKKGTPAMTMSSMHSSNVVSPLVEMEQPPTIHELPPTNFTYELPADNVERR